MAVFSFKGFYTKISLTFFFFSSLKASTSSSFQLKLHSVSCSHHFSFLFLQSCSHSPLYNASSFSLFSQIMPPRFFLIFFFFDDLTNYFTLKFLFWRLLLLLLPFFSSSFLFSRFFWQQHFFFFYHFLKAIFLSFGLLRDDFLSRLLLLFHSTFFFFLSQSCVTKDFESCRMTLTFFFFT